MRLDFLRMGRRPVFCGSGRALAVEASVASFVKRRRGLCAVGQTLSSAFMRRLFVGERRWVLSAVYIEGWVFMIGGAAVGHTVSMRSGC